MSLINFTDMHVTPGLIQPILYVAYPLAFQTPEIVPVTVLQSPRVAPPQAVNTLVPLFVLVAQLVDNLTVAVALALEAALMVLVARPTTNV